MKPAVVMVPCRPQKTLLFITVALSSLFPTQSRPNPNVLLARTRREQATRLVRGKIKLLSSPTGEEAHAKVKMLTAMLTEAIGEAAWYDAGGGEAGVVERATNPPAANQAQLSKAWSDVTAVEGFGDGTEVEAEAEPTALDFPHDPVDCNAKAIMFVTKE